MGRWFVGCIIALKGTEPLVSRSIARRLWQRAKTHRIIDWNAKTGRRLRSRNLIDIISADVVFSSNCSEFAYGGDNTAVHVRSATSGEDRGTFKGGPAYTIPIGFFQIQENG